MVPWYTFYESIYEPEIKYGPYEQLVSSVSFGPTQAERVLVHTHVLETAHERRFCVAQDDTDMSQFEEVHSHRMAKCLDHLEKHFMSHQSDAVAAVSPPNDQDMLGIIPASSRWQSCHDHLPGPSRIDNAVILASNPKKRPSSSPVSDWKRVCLEQDPIDADDTDSSWSPISVGTMATINRTEAELRRTVPYPPRQQRETRKRKPAQILEQKLTV